MKKIRKVKVTKKKLVLTLLSLILSHSFFYLISLIVTTLYFSVTGENIHMSSFQFSVIILGAVYFYLFMLIWGSVSTLFNLSGGLALFAILLILPVWVFTVGAFLVLPTAIFYRYLKKHIPS